MALTKFALSLGPRPADLGIASPQENSWAGHTARRLGNKCLCSTASCRSFRLCWRVGNENGDCQFLCSQRRLPTFSKISINKSSSCFVRCCFYIASPWADVSLRMETQLSLALPAHPLLAESVDFLSFRLKVLLVI